MPTRRRSLQMLSLLPFGLSLAAAGPAHAAEPQTFQRRGLAIGGTDPVAYFEGNGPVTGGAAHRYDWNGATWQFASAANKDAFAATPERFAPAFGGYCAWAASRGYLAPTIPEAWSLYEGRLYLNANRRIRRRWMAELPTIIAAGEANWPAILG